MRHYRGWIRQSSPQFLCNQLESWIHQLCGKVLALRNKCHPQNKIQLWLSSTRVTKFKSYDLICVEWLPIDATKDADSSLFSTGSYSKQLLCCLSLTCGMAIYSHIVPIDGNGAPIKTAILSITHPPCMTVFINNAMPLASKFHTYHVSQQLDLLTALSSQRAKNKQTRNGKQKFADDHIVCHTGTDVSIKFVVRYNGYT